MFVSHKNITVPPFVPRQQFQLCHKSNTAETNAFCSLLVKWPNIAVALVFLSLIRFMVSVDIKHHVYLLTVALGAQNQRKKYLFWQNWML